MDPEVSPRLTILDPEGDAPAVVRQPQHADRPRRHPRFAFLARPVDPRRLERLAGVTSLIAVSWVAASSRVAGTEAPPEAETRNSPVPTGPAKTMTPSRFQAPPRPAEASQRTWGGPPEASILFSLTSAKKPSDRLSADQKGYVTPSVAARGWAATSSRARAHNRFLPSWLLATNAMRRPSGERTGGPSKKLKVAFAGGSSIDWITRGGSRVASPQRETTSPARAATSTVAAHAIRSRSNRPAAGAAGVEPPSRIQLNSFSRSCALCQRQGLEA